MTEDSLRSDISFMKTIVTEGGRPFARDAAVLVATGLVWGLASLTAWAYYRSLIMLPRPAMQGMLGATLPLIIIISMVLRRTLPQRPAGAASQGLNASWSALAVAFAVALVALIAAAAGTRDHTIPRLIPAMMFAFYGAGWLAAYMVIRKTVHGAIAAGCFAFTIASGALVDAPELWLAHGAGLLMFVVLPGLAVVRDAKRATVNGNL
jgi:hypothetical protein